jgi:hypothetical protein
MARHHNSEGKQRNNISKRLTKVEREISEMRKTTPIPPEEAANMATAREARPGEKMAFMRVKPGNANFETPVRDHMKRLQGRSTSGVRSDQERGASSPLSARRRK